MTSEPTMCSIVPVRSLIFTSYGTPYGCALSSFDDACMWHMGYTLPLLQRAARRRPGVRADAADTDFVEGRYVAV